MEVGDDEWKERVHNYNRRQRLLRGSCECGALYPEEHTARREGVIEGRREVCDAAARVLAPADFERLAAELARADAPARGCSSYGATEPHAVDADGNCVTSADSSAAPPRP